MKLSYEEKLKVWTHYMITQVILNEKVHEFNLKCRGVGKSKKYPVLGIKTKTISKKHPIKTFDEFINPTEDKRVSECLEGWYWRFKDIIFK